MQEKLLTPTEVQQQLRISKSTLYRLIRSGQLPYVRIGDAYRIRASELEEYLANSKHTQSK